MLIANPIYDVVNVSKEENEQEAWRTISAYMDEKEIKIRQFQKELEEKNKKLDEKDREIEEMKRKLDELNKKLTHNGN